jgi:hypothetical protein
METNQLSSHAECSWTGVSPDGQSVVRCGRVALALVTDRSEESSYACEEHMSQVKARRETGRSTPYHEVPGRGEDLSRRAVVV